MVGRIQQLMSCIKVPKNVQTDSGETMGAPLEGQHRPAGCGVTDYLVADS